MSLSGQVAVITGASSGIGVGVAEELNRAGMKLLLTARRADRLEQLAQSLDCCETVPGDIADPQLPQKLMDAAVEQFGRCDVVFNSAGVWACTVAVGSIRDHLGGSIHSGSCECK